MTVVAIVIINRCLWSLAVLQLFLAKIRKEKGQLVRENNSTRVINATRGHSFVREHGGVAIPRRVKNVARVIAVAQSVLLATPSDSGACELRADYVAVCMYL